MGASRSAANSKLVYGNATDLTRYCVLSFGAKEGVTQRGKTDGSSNVAFYPRNGAFAEPTYGTSPEDPGGVAVVIDIPYADSVSFERTETYGNRPYVWSDGVSQFGIEPRRIPRTTVFTFKGVDTAQDIALLDGAGRTIETFYPKGAMPSYVNLYLYNQPADPKDYGMRHTDAFASMLSYWLAGKKYDVSLYLDNNRQATCTSVPTDSPANGWVADDMKALAELSSGMLICDFSPNLSEENRTKIGTLGIDPAACIQGWGS